MNTVPATYSATSSRCATCRASRNTPAKTPTIAAPSGCSHISVPEPATSTTSDATCAAPGRSLVASALSPPAANAVKAIEIASPRPSSPGPGWTRNASPAARMITTGPM